MIMLRRLRLVNWHNFEDATIDFDMITYMIGVNAVGKTTVMDAIRYCLTTNKSFNALGNKKSGRTLQGSVHAKQRGVDSYSRPGHTVAYIGTEFIDMSKQSTFVIVVRVESESPYEELRHVQQDWFISQPGCTLEMLPFIDPHTKAPTKKELFHLQKGQLKPAKNQGEAKAVIGRVLGIGTEKSPLTTKFYEVFHMGTSLDEIANFRDFIYNYVLPQPDLDLDVLQRDKIELEHLQGVLDEAKKRAEMLTDIVASGQQAMALQTDVDVNQGFILYAKNRDATELENRYLDQLERANREYDRLQAQYEELAQQEEAADKAYFEARTEKQDSSEVRMLEALRGQLAEKKKAWVESQKKQNHLEHALGQISQLLGALQKYDICVQPELLPENIEMRPAEQQRELLAQFVQTAKALEPKVEDAYLSGQQKIKDLEQRRLEIKDAIRVLMSGRLVYPDGDCANKVKATINKELRLRGMDEDARVLCELLYMNDTSWQSCAEACLGGRRFDILVSPKHYPAAKQVFVSLGDGVGRISLLDTPSLERSTKNCQAPGEDRLASKLSSENLLAKGYVNSMLGEIVCCDTSDTLEQFLNSATKDLLRHHPFRLERMRRPQNFIGLEARKNQLANLEKELTQLQKQLDEAKLTREPLQTAYHSYQTVLRGTALTDLTEYWGSRQLCDTCWQEYDTLEKKIHSYEQSPLMLAMLQREKIYKEQLDVVRKKMEGVSGEKAVCTSNAKTAQAQQEQAIVLAETAELALEQYWVKFPLIEEAVAAKYAEASKSRTAAEIYKNQTDFDRQLKNRADRFLLDTLCPKQRQYNDRYTCDYPLGLDGMDSFALQHQGLVNIDLERYSAQLEQAQMRCKERFRRDVLYRIGDDIDNAKRQFKELNRVMEQLCYGEEEYRFVVDGSKDAQLSAFYKVIIDKNNTPVPQAGTLESLVAGNNAAYESQVDELMERIMVDISVASKERQEGKKMDAIELSSYVDYRTYLDYDIKITNRVTQEIAFLSSVSQDSSGGENQAPFYVAICSSLLQIYQKSENSIRLVLLDEAFSRMTSDRIQPMMKMFADMKLQVILISTVEKSSAIYPFCDITYSIIRKGSRNAIMPFIQEELWSETIAKKS